MVPEDEPTVIAEVLLLLQVPPDVVSVNVELVPTQTEDIPPIFAGNGFTVTSS